MMNCVFCQIARKKIPAKCIHEDDKILIFADIHPKAPVHYLAVPKEHIQSIMHLEKSHQEIISRLIFGAKEAAEKLGLKGYKLVFNVGREGGQIIDHLHLHLLGGWNRSEDIEAMPHPGI